MYETKSIIKASCFPVRTKEKNRLCCFFGYQLGSSSEIQALVSSSLSTLRGLLR